jgi:hypothetical protein
MRDLEHKREYDRKRMRRIRAERRVERQARWRRYHERQLGPDHDPVPPGFTLEQHREYSRMMLSIPPVEEILGLAKDMLVDYMGLELRPRSWRHVNTLQ